MARERRTSFTLPNDTGPATPAGRRTATCRRVTGRQATGAYASAGATVRARAVSSRHSVSPLFWLVLILVAAGGGWYGYGKYQEQQRIARERAKLEREQKDKQRLEELEREKIAKAEERKRKHGEAERKRREEDARRAEESLAGFGKVEKKAVARKKEETAVAETEEITASPEFLQAMAEANGLLKKGEWEAANARFTAAAAAVAPQDDQASAKGLGAAALMFRDLTAQTKLAVETKAEELYWVTLKNGNRFRGKLDQENSGVDDLLFVKDGGGGQRVSPKEIKEKKLMTQEQRDREMLEDLAARKKKAGDDAVAWYLCGVKALEYGQRPVSVECFSTAAEKDPGIARTAREFLASRLFASAMFDRQLKNKRAFERKIKELREKYPDSRAAMNADGTLAEADALAKALAEEKAERVRLAKMKKDEAEKARRERRQKRPQNQALAEIEDDIAAAMGEITEDAASPGSDAAKADVLSKQANEQMRTAQTCDSRALSNQSYKDALAGFRQAAALYQRALDQKFDPSLEQKLHKAQQNMYWCRKLQTR